MKKLVCLAVVLLATGCFTRYDVGPCQGIKLERGRQLCVVTPEDGGHAGQIYAGSGALTAALLRDALASRAVGAAVAPRPGDMRRALRQAAADGYRYVFHPRVVSWELREDAWRPARVDVLIAVYDLKQGGRMITQRNIVARGRISVLTGQTPADIMKPLFERYAEEMF